MNWIALKILASGFVDIIHCQNVTLCICIDITNNYSFSTSFSMLNFSSVFISSSIPYGTISAVIIIFNKVIHPKFSLFFLSRLFRTHVNSSKKLVINLCVRQFVYMYVDIVFFIRLAQSCRAWCDIFNSITWYHVYIKRFEPLWTCASVYFLRSQVIERSFAR